MRPTLFLCVFLLPTLARAADESFVQSALSREIIGLHQGMLDIQAHIEHKILPLPTFPAPAQWNTYANTLRNDILTQVVFRGKATAWRDAKPNIEWQGTIEGGEGYKIRKARYEAVPGLWIPALLYEPTSPPAKIPVMLAVNGHDPKGKAAGYKQTRCINLAKRGMLVLNVEWYGMGQLAGAGLGHYRMNQLDLCGTSGIAPFYLAMTRGIDLLLSRPGADPTRVAVSGLSGGGWQTIFVSSLDTRVTLANPVAGYSPFGVKFRDHFKDLGDSEQAACDLGKLADYTHLTALRAPRPTLLTYNRKDNCCFEAGYTLPPLLDTARPVFRLLGQENALRSHINDDPGTHNFEKDNRQALYRMVGDFFFADDKKYSADEISCEKEIKKAEELAVELPADNQSFNTLALGLAKELPRNGTLPTNKDAVTGWQTEKRRQLREVIKPFDLTVKVAEKKVQEKDGTTASFYKLDLNGAWKLPVVVLERGKSKGTTILIEEGGRKKSAAEVEELLKAGQLVVVVDPWYFGESEVASKDVAGTQKARPFLFVILMQCLGDRALGLQASQVSAVARWAETFSHGPVTIRANGPRVGLIALVAAALEEKAIGGLEVAHSLGSLKEVIEQNHGMDQMPEVFCFGLLEAVDVPQLVALVAPRRVTLREPTERARKELAGLKAWYGLLGVEHAPF
jgi:hypothetical protein